jgi:hypothetical protein
MLLLLIVSSPNFWKKDDDLNEARDASMMVMPPLHSVDRQRLRKKWSSNNLNLNKKHHGATILNVDDAFYTEIWHIGKRSFYSKVSGEV